MKASHNNTSGIFKIDNVFPGISSRKFEPVMNDQNSYRHSSMDNLEELSVSIPDTEENKRESRMTIRSIRDNSHEKEQRNSLSGNSRKGQGGLMPKITNAFHRLLHSK